MAKPPNSRIKANRQNARFSTGPRTAAGKSRVARNALRHGLAVSIAALPEFDSRITRLTDLLAGVDADDERRELARRVAEAEIDLIRVRQARWALLAKPMTDPEYLQTKNIEAKILAAVRDLSRRKRTFSDDEFFASVARRRAPPLRSGDAERAAAILHALAKELERLDRYERRAISRRKFAVRSFAELI